MEYGVTAKCHKCGQEFNIYFKEGVRYLSQICPTCNAQVGCVVSYKDVFPYPPPSPHKVTVLPYSNKHKEQVTDTEKELTKRYNIFKIRGNERAQWLARLSVWGRYYEYEDN